MQVRAAIIAAATALALASAGCAGAELEEMRHQVDAQQAQIDRQGQLIAQLRAQQQPAGTTLPPPGSCDGTVMHKAIAHGDDQYAAGKYTIALGYYQDAATACPGNAQVELSLARAYEKSGDRQQAAHHYKLARDAAGSDNAAAEQARQGMARLGGGP
jgi:tetratricopeptide (TPR) repeat protein